MGITPDRKPGPSVEEELQLTDEGVDPSVVGGIVLKAGNLLGRDAAGIFNLRSAGGGGSLNTGSADLDFGGTGAALTSVVVTGQTGILSGSTPWAVINYDTTADHNEWVHLVLPLQLRCGDIVPGVGFTIYGYAGIQLRGLITVRWFWA